MSELRQRSAAKPEDKETKTDTPSVSQLVEKEDSAFSLLDIARTLVFVLLLSGATSYFVTRESFTWNLDRPKWTRPEVLQAWLSGPKEYTDADLAAYDGTDPDKPILLAINGTIYDVSKGGKHYGPGGSYHFFAGADASRGFVTGCFAEDRTPDMRGVEEMFIPLDDPAIDSQYTSGQLKALREQERRHAKEEVQKALQHWVDFFANSKKYTRVGTVKREEGWEEKLERRELCEPARKKRKARKAPGDK
ncbi:hypothetical protein OIDMADRAFT_170147 [Oidiodendron maius Zn]|uniref:Cytochrome b5 heme-binding domain-containing protein n=1 Tax=Oidiodendron maius (strain Zn) TaxID=913774 RepID=A0A0C3H1Q0_OIDMZ|nr:hypothetical protein OIDMADRAFT_170147 [Oidiodendron maius Zn]